MAFVEVNFFSQALLRQTTFRAIIPCDKMYFDGRIRQEKPFKTLYLLHGVFGDCTDWINGTRIQRWAQDRNLAVIMPSGENKFYVDHEKSTDKFSQYIKELVLVSRNMFHLSHKREDTFIAGLSMGRLRGGDQRVEVQRLVFAHRRPERRAPNRGLRARHGRRADANRAPFVFGKRVWRP